MGVAISNAHDLRSAIDIHKDAFKNNVFSDWTSNWTADFYFVVAADEWSTAENSTIFGNVSTGKIEFTHLIF